MSKTVDWYAVHPDYPSDWAVIIPNIHFGDKVIYYGSQKELHGALGVITAVTHVKKFVALFQEYRFEWRYTITLDNGKNSLLENVREESFIDVHNCDCHK